MLDELGKILTEKLVSAFREHHLTGAFEKSLRLEVSCNGVVGYGNEYGIYLDVGVKPSEIKHPYAPKRIEGLTEYGKLRKGLSNKNAKSFAYAVATKQKYGTKNSVATGIKASHFIDNALKEFSEVTGKEVERLVYDKIDNTFKNMKQ